jgi:RNA polymerase sigma-70 factor (ECF subfamily)
MARRARFPEYCDEELVLAALVGDLAAFDELVRRFRGGVVAVAEQVVGTREAAHDVAQEAFLLAFKALPQLEEPAKFAGWLCAIARHRARRVAARATRAVPAPLSELDHLLLRHSEELGAAPEEEVRRRADRAAVRAALARLAPEHQLALRLRYYEEWPVAQIAAFLSLSLPTTKWRLHQGRQRLRRALADQFEEDPDDPRRSERSGGAPHPSPAPPDRPARERSLADRRSREGRPNLRSAVQPGGARP